MTGRITHERFTLERRYDATPAQIFAAWKDVEGRTQWQKPADHLHLVYDADDFRVGGRDISRCSYGPASRSDPSRWRASLFCGLG